MSLKIHFHTDCAFFAGCENMLVSFFGSKSMREQYEVSFSYRYSRRYEQGLKQKIETDFAIYPLHFPDIYDFTLLPATYPLLLRRIFFFIVRAVFTVPLFSYEVYKLLKLFKNIQPDILHINNGGYPAALSARAAAVAGKLAGIKCIVMMVNSMAEPYNTVFRMLDYPMDQIVKRCVDRFVTGSRIARKELIHVLKLVDTKVVSIHNGIEHTPPDLPAAAVRQMIGWKGNEGITFGIVGLLIPRKGHLVLLEAAAQLLNRPEMGAFNIIIVGDGPERVNIEKYISEKKLNNHVVLVGQRNDVNNFFPLFDVFILSSLEKEDFPFVILEALSHGKPVIASKVAGTPEQVENLTTGILTDPGNVEQLVDAMLIMSSKVKRERMGYEAFNYFQTHFRADIAVNKYLSLYQGILST